MQERRITKRYSQAFQLKVVSEIESGKRTLEECRKVYDIGGSMTIQGWLRRHGKQELLNRVVHIQMKDEREKVSELQHRIAQLERAVAGLQVEKVCMLGMLDALEQTYGEEVKKNIERLPLSDQETVRRLWLGKP